MKKRTTFYVLAISLFFGGFTPSILAKADSEPKAVKNNASLSTKVKRLIVKGFTLSGAIVGFLIKDNQWRQQAQPVECRTAYHPFRIIDNLVWIAGGAGVGYIIGGFGNAFAKKRFK